MRPGLDPQRITLSHKNVLLLLGGETLPRSGLCPADAATEQSNNPAWPGPLSARSRFSWHLSTDKAPKQIASSKSDWRSEHGRDLLSTSPSRPQPAKLRQTAAQLGRVALVQQVSFDCVQTFNRPLLPSGAAESMSVSSRQRKARQSTYVVNSQS